MRVKLSKSGLWGDVELLCARNGSYPPQLNSGALIRILAGYQLHNADNVALSTEGVGNSPPGAEQFIQLLKTSLALCP